MNTVESDTQRVWDEIQVHYGRDCFLPLIEKEYGGKFSKDYSAMNQEIDKISEEARFQIMEVMKQSQHEIQTLRLQLDSKNQEIMAFKDNLLREIDKA